ncbi:MAG: hypothetical protein NZT61_04920 [Deltaproteobacteria bacterium]|nr:hypothetical protein [Deltaproteobacteria bacterium]
MLKKFREYISKPHKIVLIASNSPKLLNLLTRIYITHYKESFIIKFNCLSDSQKKFGDFINQLKQKSLFGQTRVGVLSEAQAISKKNLDDLLDALSALHCNLMIAGTEELKNLKEAVIKNKGVYFPAFLKSELDLMAVLKDILGSSFKNAAFNQTEPIDKALNRALLLRLAGDDFSKKILLNNQPSFWDLTELFLDPASHFVFLKRLSNSNTQSMHVLYTLFKRILAMICLKLEGVDKNYRLVPYWLRNQLAKNMKSWDVEDLRIALLHLLRTEFLLKSGSLNDMDIFFLNFLNSEKL